MGKNFARVAVKNVKELQAIFDQTEKPDYRLRRDLADAQAFLAAVKAKEKAKRREKAPAKIRAELVEAEKEAAVDLTAAIKAKKAAKRAKKTAKASRQELRALRQAHSFKSILETAEFEEQRLRFAFRNAEDADVAAEKQLHDANAKVQSLQSRLPRVTQALPIKEVATIDNNDASVNSNEQQHRVSPARTRSASPSPAVSNAAAEDDGKLGFLSAGQNSDEDDEIFQSDLPALDDDFPMFSNNGSNGLALLEASTASASPIKSMTSPTKSTKLSTPATTPTKDATSEAPVATWLESNQQIS